MKHFLFTLLILSTSLFSCKQDSKTAATTDAPAPVASETTSAVPGQSSVGLAVGDQLYVQVPGGLVLRKTPSKDGEKVASAAYDGKALKVMALPDPANKYVAEKIGTFEVSGGWVKVQTADGKEGYLFEGYLSKYAPLIQRAVEDMSLSEQYYRSISPAKGPQEALPANPEATAGYRQLFADGAKLEFTPYAGGHSECLLLPAGKMTMQEALVIFRRVWFGTDKTKAEFKDGLLVESTTEPAQITIESTGGRLEICYSYAD